MSSHCERLMSPDLRQQLAEELARSEAVIAQIVGVRDEIILAFAAQDTEDHHEPQLVYRDGKLWVVCQSCEQRWSIAGGEFVVAEEGDGFCLDYAGDEEDLTDQSGGESYDGG